MTFRIRGLDPAPYRACFTLSQQALEDADMAIVISDAEIGYPCRVGLDDAAPGERLLLVNHVSQKSGPYRASHAIFVSETGIRADFNDAIPPALDRRILSLRAFDASGMMVDAALVDPGEADAVIRTLFASVEIDHIDAHNAVRGCFAARVERA